MQKTMKQQKFSTMDLVSVIKSCKFVATQVQGPVDTLVALANGRLPAPPPAADSVSTAIKAPQVLAPDKDALLELQVSYQQTRKLQRLHCERRKCTWRTTPLHSLEPTFRHGCRFKRPC